jgi:hypothetical protein
MFPPMLVTEEHKDVREFFKQQMGTSNPDAFKWLETSDFYYL